MPMTHRQRMLAALHHREPDRVPRTAILTPGVLEAFRAATGADDPAAHLDWDVASVGFRPPEPRPDLHARYGRYHAHREEEWQLDWAMRDYPPEWGVASRPAHLFHLAAPLPPMERFTTVREVEDYPYPDYAGEWRGDHLAAEVARLHDAGWFVDAHVGWIFQTAWTLRSEVSLFTDFYERRDMACALLRRITDIRVAQARALTAASVDSISLNDDIGGQRGMLLSPRMWREWLKPLLAELIAAVRAVNPKVLFRYHSDGNYQAVIPELIDIGVSSLRTVQPEAMDLATIKRDFGRDIVIEGTFGLQRELRHGTPEEVREVVRQQCALLMPGGGWIASPGNGVTPDIPIENVLALFAALDEFGVY